MSIAGTAALATLLVVGAARAEEAAPPAPDEVRLTLTLNGRSVAFNSTLEPLARRTIAFEGQDHAPTESLRAVAAELAPLLAAAPAKSAFVVVAYAADPVVAYRRARALRGDLIERHQIGAARLVATGRAAPGHSGGATIVDIQAIDPAACSGCGETPFRTIAYDSGTTGLVTVLPERLASAGAAPKPAVPQAVVSKPVLSQPAAPTAAASRIDPPKPVRSEAPVRPSAAAVVSPAPRRIVPATAAPRAPMIRQAGGCPRPKIIIDDYYPGGPLVPCGRAAREGSR
jgi:hypothetical protein